MFQRMHKELNKFEYVVLTHFNKLILSDNGEKEAAEEGSNQTAKGRETTEDCAGTGMGQGRGKTDVSEQLENEEQMLGLKGDKEEEQGAEDRKDEFGADVDAVFFLKLKNANFSKLNVEKQK